MRLDRLKSRRTETVPQPAPPPPEEAHFIAFGGWAPVPPGLRPEGEAERRVSGVNALAAVKRPKPPAYVAQHGGVGGR